MFQDKSVVEIVEDVFADYAEAGALAPAWRWELRDRSVYPKRSLINLTGGSGRPTIQVDDSGAAYLAGQLGSAGFGVGIRNFLERLLGDGKQFVDVDDFGMELVYKPDRNQLPALETVLRFPVARR